MPAASPPAPFTVREVGAVPAAAVVLPVHDVDYAAGVTGLLEAMAVMVLNQKTRMQKSGKKKILIIL